MYNDKEFLAIYDEILADDPQAFNESLGDCDLSDEVCRHRLVEAIEITLLDIQNPDDGLTEEEHKALLRSDEQKIGWALLHLIRFHGKPRRRA